MIKSWYVDYGRNLYLFVKFILNHFSDWKCALNIETNYQLKVWKNKKKHVISLIRILTLQTILHKFWTHFYPPIITLLYLHSEIADASSTRSKRQRKFYHRDRSHFDDFGECNRQTHKTAEFVGGRRGEQSRKRGESDGKQPLGVSVKPATPIH